MPHLSFYHATFNVVINTDYHHRRNNTIRMLIKNRKRIIIQMTLTTTTELLLLTHRVLASNIFDNMKHCVAIGGNDCCVAGAAAGAVVTAG